MSGIIIKHGSPFDLLEAWRAGFFALLMSGDQRAELERVLHRPSIRDRYGLTDGEIATLLRLIDATASSVRSRRRPPVPVRDPKDEMILASALGSKADYLVTGDADLLALQGEQALGSLRIVTVAVFLRDLSSR